MAPHRSTAKTRTKTVYCDECGRPQVVGKNKRNRVRCIQCSTTAATENMTQMVAKSGPYYARWIEGMIKAIDKATRGEGGGAQLRIQNEMFCKNPNNTIAYAVGRCRAGDPALF